MYDLKYFNYKLLFILFGVLVFTNSVTSEVLISELQEQETLKIFVYITSLSSLIVTNILWSIVGIVLLLVLFIYPIRKIMKICNLKILRYNKNISREPLVVVNGLLTMNMKSDKSGLLQKIESKLNRFNVLAHSLQFLFAFLAITSVVFSLIVATFSTELEEQGTLKIFAYITALSSSIISAFSLNTKSSDARTAWRLLNIALMRHQNDSKKTTEEDLIRAYGEAEQTLGHVVFNPSKEESSMLKKENEELKQKIFDLEEKIFNLSERESESKDN